MRTKFISIFFIVVFFYSCNSSDDADYISLVAEENEAFSGGETTVFNSSSEAFGFFENDDNEISGLMANCDQGNLLSEVEESDDEEDLSRLPITFASLMKRTII